MSPRVETGPVKLRALTNVFSLDSFARSSGRMRSARIRFCGCHRPPLPRSRLTAIPCSVDLGSGVGNAVIGVSLLSGSNSYGCESMPNPSRLAALQIQEAKRRWAMWCLKGSDACEAYQADFCEDAKTSAALRKADLVLVNNYAFTPALNDRLAWQFLDLKEGAKIISLKPFLTKDFRLTERTVSETC